jgi:LysM repeat protein
MQPDPINRNAAFRFLLILFALILSLSLVESSQAEENLSQVDNRTDLIWSQRGFVVQPTHTPSEPTPVPIVISTPRFDGTVIHTIGSGQSLWAISEAYNVPFEDLLELNDLEPEAVVLPGDEVIISPSYTPTSTPIGEPSATPPPRYSHTPSLGTPQETELSFSPATPEPTETLNIEPRFQTSVKKPLVVIAAVAISGGVLAAALYFSLRKQ